MGTTGENWFRSLPNEAQHSQFLHDVVGLLLKEAVFEGTQRDNLVVRWRDPEQLQTLFNFEPSDMPATHTELLRIIHDTVVFSVKTGHPHFINQLFSRLVKYTIILSDQFEALVLKLWSADHRWSVVRSYTRDLQPFEFEGLFTSFI